MKIRSANRDNEQSRQLFSSARWLTFSIRTCRLNLSTRWWMLSDRHRGTHIRFSRNVPSGWQNISRHERYLLMYGWCYGRGSECKIQNRQPAQSACIDKVPVVWAVGGRFRWTRSDEYKFHIRIYRRFHIFICRGIPFQKAFCLVCLLFCRCLELFVAERRFIQTAATSLQNTNVTATR